MGRAPAPSPAHLLLAALAAVAAVGVAALGSAPLGWQPARRLLAIMQTFSQPPECQILPEADVLSALATIDGECPQAAPFVCGSPGAPCYDSLAKLGYKCASAVAKVQAMADGKNATQAASRIISLFKACPKALLAASNIAPAPPARSPSPPPPVVPSPSPTVPQPPTPAPAPVTPGPPPISGTVTPGGNATDGLAWSPWLGRDTGTSASGVCPCPGFITGVSVWYEQGLQATASDSSPISGLVAICSGADNVTTELAVMPGPGEPKSVQSFPSGLTAIPLKYGSPMGYLDSILGVGGTGATVVTYTCPAGTQAAGFHVAWEPATAAAGGNVTGPLDLATGIRIHCRAASNCTAIGT